jgi:ankyrin repeat protein
MLSFEEAVERVRSISSLSNEHKLELYGLYKQATLGDTPVSFWPVLDPIAAAKQNSWTKFKGLSQQQAETKYMQLVNSLQDSATSESKSLFGAPSVSRPILDGDEEEKVSQVVRIVNEGDLEALKSSILQDPSCVYVQDSSKRTPLHMAADRGRVEMVQILIANGAWIDAQDEEGDTPLHLASICEHQTVIDLLIEKGANPLVLNKDGEAALV